VNRVAIESLARPVIDALMKALDRARDAHLKKNARRAIAEAISELIRIHPDLDKARARIAVARAAGILDQELFTAERMLKSVKKTARKAGGATAKPVPWKKPASRRVVKRRDPVRRGKSATVQPKRGGKK
jgi:hypothetical protein